MREEFEKLPEIARMVACDEIKWCDIYHWYRTDNTDANSIYHVAWLNGAWYAFQEQKKKLDCCREENKTLLDKLNIPDGYKLVPVSFLKDINSVAVDEFHKWKIKEEQMPAICEYMQGLSFYIGVEK